MTSQRIPATGLRLSAPMDQVRAAKLEATQRLLGSTMGISEDQWQSPSLLPGWTRAHVATHLARGAEALTGIVLAIVEGRTVPPMYPSPEQRDTDIERGSERTGLELQIDLDTTAERLHESFDGLVGELTDVPVTLAPDITVRACQLPAVRLAEVLLHHVDLDAGFDLSQSPALAARCLLEWVAYRLRDRVGIPALHIVSESGFSDRIGGTGFATTVRGSDAALAGWLSGRADGSTLEGTDNLALPLLA